MVCAGCLLRLCVIGTPGTQGPPPPACVGISVAPPPGRAGLLRRHKAPGGGPRSPLQPQVHCPTGSHGSRPSASDVGAPVPPRAGPVAATATIKQRASITSATEGLFACGWSPRNLLRLLKPYTLLGLDHGVGHPKSLFVMPPYATLRSRRCARESLRCFFARHFCHGAHHKHDRMVPSQTMNISIETLDTCCLISPCKIPANLLHNPRRGLPR